MSVRNKNCFRSQSGSVIEMANRPSVTTPDELSEGVHSDIHSESLASDHKRKSASKILQKRYYFYD